MQSKFFKFKNLLILSSIAFSSWAQTTGISGVDTQVTTGTRILQVFQFLVGLGCISVAAYMFGSGKAKEKGLEWLFGLLVMAGLVVGGIAWWTSQSSGFMF